MKPIKPLALASILLCCSSPSKYTEVVKNVTIDSDLVGEWKFTEDVNSKIRINTNGQITFVNADSQITGDIYTHSNSSFKIIIPKDTILTNRIFIYYIQNDSLIFSSNTFFLTSISEHNGIVGKWKFDSLVTVVYNSNIMEFKIKDSILFSTHYSIDSHNINYDKNYGIFESGIFYSLVNDTLVMGSYDFNKKIYTKSKEKLYQNCKPAHKVLNSE